MIFDKLCEFADATTVSVATPTDDALIGNVMDLGAAPTLKNLGSGEPVYLVVQLDAAYVAATTGNVTFKLCSDSTANLATSKTTHITLPALTSATGVKGYRYVAALPSDETYERYLGFWGTNAATTATAGSVTAFLTTKTPPFQYATFLPDGIA